MTTQVIPLRPELVESSQAIKPKKKKFVKKIWNPKTGETKTITNSFEAVIGFIFGPIYALCLLSFKGFFWGMLLDIIAFHIPFGIFLIPFIHMLSMGIAISHRIGNRMNEGWVDV